MKVDGGIFDLATAAETARAQEDEGYAGLWVGETAHDPFLPLLLAAQVTERVELGTGITVAFARSPMTTATTANDLHRASKGRHILGLGSQTKPHIENRFSMPWSHPAARMREFVLAVRAIWDCWNSGTKLDFRGDFYTHTLMTPFFSPGPNPYGTPKVFLAAVGEQMTEVAGEVADGLLVHPFTTERYLKEVTLPAMSRGLARAGRSRADVHVAFPVFLVTDGDGDRDGGREEAVRRQIAFYGSTPAYRGVLELHGWGELQPELNALSKQGRWQEMARLIDDDVLDAFAVVAALSDAPQRIIQRYGGAVDRVSFYAPVSTEAAERRRLVEALQQ